MAWRRRAGRWLGAAVLLVAAATDAAAPAIAAAQESTRLQQGRSQIQVDRGALPGAGNRHRLTTARPADDGGAGGHDRERPGERWRERRQRWRDQHDAHGSWDGRPGAEADWRRDAYRAQAEAWRRREAWRRHQDLIRRQHERRYYDGRYSFGSGHFDHGYGLPRRHFYSYRWDDAGRPWSDLYGFRYGWGGSRRPYWTGWYGDGWPFADRWLRREHLRPWVMFNFDRDRDGWLDSIEGQYAGYAFRRFADRNGDGRISEREYERAREALRHDDW